MKAKQTIGSLARCYIKLLKSSQDTDWLISFIGEAQVQLSDFGNDQGSSILHGGVYRDHFIVEADSATETKLSSWIYGSQRRAIGNGRCDFSVAKYQRGSKLYTSAAPRGDVGAAKKT
jgi:hypothetical protein